MRAALLRDEQVSAGVLELLEARAEPKLLPVATRYELPPLRNEGQWWVSDSLAMPFRYDDVTAINVHRLPPLGIGFLSVAPGSLRSYKVAAILTDGDPAHLVMWSDGTIVVPRALNRFNRVIIVATAAHRPPRVCGVEVGWQSRAVPLNSPRYVVLDDGQVARFD